MTLPSNLALVNLVIQYLQVHPAKLGGVPAGVPPEKLANLIFPDGKPLPPSLKQWLAFDARHIGIFEDLVTPVAVSHTLSEISGPLYTTMDRLLFPANFYCLFPQDYDCSRYSLYTGEADEEQEYPVLLTDIDDRIWPRRLRLTLGSIWLKSIRCGILTYMTTKKTALVISRFWNTPK